MTSELTGRVVGQQGQYFVVVCDVAESSHLRWHDLLRSQLKDANVGDAVRMRYYSDNNRGFWHVTEVIK